MTEGNVNEAEDESLMAFGELADIKLRAELKQIHHMATQKQTLRMERKLYKDFT